MAGVTRRQAMIAAAASLAYLYGKPAGATQAQQYGVPSGSIMLPLDGVPALVIRYRGRQVVLAPEDVMNALQAK